MTQAHEFINHVLNNNTDAANSPDGFHWHHIMTALNDVIALQSDESEEVLRAILATEGAVNLSPKSSPSHAMSPKDMMRSIAIQTLAQWDKDKHRDLITQTAQTAKSPLLAAIARKHL